jgi:hypothetical protein
LDAPAGKPTESSVGELFGRLGEDGRAFVQAEIGLVKAIAVHRIGNARNGAIALFLALLLVNAAVIALAVSIALALALHLGPLLGGLITFAGICLIAALLGWWGVGRLGALAGDAEERAALASRNRNR